MGMNFVDNGVVCLSGQNPFMILFDQPGGVPINLASLWHIDFSPCGTGSVLFLAGEATSGQLRAFTDSTALARYISSEIYAVNAGPFQRFSEPDLSIIEASFDRSGDARSSVTEFVKSRTEQVALTWQNFLAPFKGGTAADPKGGRAHAHYALYFPAQEVSLLVNGNPARGVPIPMKRGERDMTSCGLAWAETWTKAVDG
jgi:hypothetical protein